MRKPESLRDLLTKVVPAIAADPTRLAIFVDAGRIAARVGPTLSYEYRYTLDLVVQDYAGDRDAVIVPVLAWIAQHQPDLLTRPDGEPIRFEAELLDADSCDLSIKLDLTESVRVVTRAGGGYEVRHLGEPCTADGFPGLCDVTLWQLFLNDQLALQTSDPAFVP